MTTYLINHLRIPGGVPNEAGLQYLERVEATVAAYGGRWLAQGDPDVVEGAWPGSVVLLEFPDRASAQAWYESPEYREILTLRTDNAISDLVFIDGLPEDFTVAGFAGQVRAMVGGSCS
ncbi:DUF1330 domain-containing protein [Microbacterium caowuchunii]|uniref:DUF1330 domain-containing protein n=1 Tax=Microbacterium caowuchunii TaxID=2614638 RepID=A0A5N0TQD7_9MICO|nr:DUF1330 domain-containing protein [Microbacterium caowuchunii]KAA9136126.1 DUF1330 domain-containing protein [Microbacterium caowuchunii]